MNPSTTLRLLPLLRAGCLWLCLLIGFTQPVCAQYPALADPPAASYSGLAGAAGDRTVTELGFAHVDSSFASKAVGDVVEMQVTGSGSGTIWGSIVYTSDSDVATAAVHAGVLKDGETGQIKVTVLPGRASYEGSSRHGISSRDYTHWDKSFWVERLPEKPTTSEVVQSGAQTVITLTGRTDGTIWGNGIYTDDSDLATAAVHSGVLKAGETGRVRITTLPGQQSYPASQSHGVSSQSWESWSGSYRLERADSPVEIAQPPTSLTQFRGQHGHVVNLRVTGRTSGTVWGTDVYTDDSDMATAAVHAGILQDGQTGSVRVTILPGRSQYRESTQNGVTTSSYGRWQGSFWIDSATEDITPTNQHLLYFSSPH